MVVLTSASLAGHLGYTNSIAFQNQEQALEEEPH